MLNKIATAISDYLDMVIYLIGSREKEHRCIESDVIILDSDLWMCSRCHKLGDYYDYDWEVRRNKNNRKIQW